MVVETLGLAELAYAFEAPESSHRPLTAADVIARNRT